MQTSPYFTGSAPNFAPPSGMAGLISQGRDGRVDMSGLQQFADAAEKFKQVQDAGKAADYFVKANPDALSSMGIHQDEWQTLGARDKSAAVTGLVKSQAQQEVMQRMADVAAQARERNAQAQATQDTGTFLKAYAADLPEDAEDTPQTRLAQGLSALPPTAEIGRVFPQAMNSLEKFATIGANANNATSFDEDPVTGFRVARLGRQIIPSGTDPAKLSTTGPVTSDDNQFFFNGKTWMNKKGTEITPKDALKTYNTNQKRMGELQTSLQMAQDPKYASILDKDALTSELTDLQAQQATLKPVWQPNAPAAAAAPVPLPKTKAELKAGQVYQTPRGAATWDGQKFVSQ